MNIGRKNSEIGCIDIFTQLPRMNLKRNNGSEIRKG